MYRVSQRIDFCYGHRLLDYQGKCRHLHGHNGRAIIVLEAGRLDPRGMIVDFAEIKRAIRTWIESHLDHRMILCRRDPVVDALQKLNEPLLVMEENPTAENIAKMIYDRVKEMGFPVVEVSLWETPSSCATFRER
ncbi:MAG: 6-carboxytetrahydropterin synthase [Planctomycetes bacterium]|nr:6-carboxytetrahydropterin synthase [Planctomycetota bacterium]